MKIKRREFFESLRNQLFYNSSLQKCNEELSQYILSQIGSVKLSENDIMKIKQEIKYFVSKMFRKWRECKYTYERFNNKNKEWLDENFKLLETQLPVLPSSSVEQKSEQANRGRTKKSFKESSECSKQRYVRTIISDHSTEKLYSAAETSLVKSGKRTAAEIVKLAITSSPRSLKKMRLVHDAASSSCSRSYSPEEALALMVDLGLTKEGFIMMRLGAKERGADIYPSYYIIAKAKEMFYTVNIKINENEAIVSVQDLLNHTVQRLSEIQADVILQNISYDRDTIEVYYKWGLDGSGGHSI